MLLALGARVPALGQEPEFWAGLCPQAWEPLLLLGEEGSVRSACSHLHAVFWGISSGALLRVCMSSFLPLQVLSPADGYDSGPKFVNTGCVKRK